MRIIKDIKEMQMFSDKTRKQGKIIAFVPTMGFLHDGHKSLLKEGRKYDCLVMSIFVNPTQFGPNEDYNSYPRDMERDLRIAEEEKVDIVFNPEVKDMYPDGFKTYVEVKDLSKNLCGLSRPSHFQGVAAIVAKLFNIVKPNIAIFGQKDFQQMSIIKKMARDLNFDIDIIGMPIVREKDGLAMSSRNTYLNTKERDASLCIYRAITKAKNMFNKGARDTDEILKEVRKVIELEAASKIDYIKICDIETLEDIKIIKNKALLAIAVFIGKTRLIDNCVLSDMITPITKKTNYTDSDKEIGFKSV
ncbi:MAG: pantoate--beta-alanine ligase [Deltaproteobacteria bacterium]|nr:pantoate--beta-alanine ligase [Deltaproteobacteria bacterium]